MLRYRADLRTLAFVAIYFGLTIGLWIVQPKQWFIAVPWVIVTCFFSFFGAVITHNTVHAPVFEQRWLNRIFQVVLTLTYGHPVSSFVPGHNLSHHKHTQSRKDVMRTSKMRFRWNLLNGLFFMFRMAPDIMRADSKYAAAMRTRKPAWFHQMLLELISLYAVYAVLLILDWRLFLLYVYLPHRYAGWGIITMNLLQHDGCDETSAYNHSRNFTGRWVNFFTFNNGFHTIHHHKASLHWSLTPEAHAEEIAPHIDPRLDEPSLLAYVWRAFIWPAKRLRYDGTPLVLPEEGPDEDWIPAPKETPQDVSLGAIS
ncbi:MAG: fatty acid desaturase [Polyangiaceae bacterium]